MNLDLDGGHTVTVEIPATHYGLYRDFLRGHSAPIAASHPPGWNGVHGVVPVSPTVLGTTARVCKYAAGVGVAIGVSYLGYYGYRWLRNHRASVSICNRFEDFCGGDPPGADCEDAVLRQLDEEDQLAADSLRLRLSTVPDKPIIGAPTPPQSPRGPAAPPGPSRSGGARNHAGSYHRPYDTDGSSLRGSYLPRLVSELRAKNSGITYTRANYLQIQRLAYKMMSDHGMRAYDIDRNIRRVALAVFFVTEEDKLVEQEFEVLKQAGRIRMDFM